MCRTDSFTTPATTGLDAAGDLYNEALSKEMKHEMEQTKTKMRGIIAKCKRMDLSDRAVGVFFVIMGGAAAIAVPAMGYIGAVRWGLFKDYYKQPIDPELFAAAVSLLKDAWFYICPSLGIALIAAGICLLRKDRKHSLNPTKESPE